MMYKAGCRSVWLWAGVLVAGLSACSSTPTSPASVSDRTSPGRSVTASGYGDTPSAVPVARAGYYVVRKGDTLYSIAQQHRKTVRELVALNQLENPNLIEVGQELRVSDQVAPVTASPVMSASGVVTQPIQQSSQPEARPLGAPGSSSPVATSAATLKREPKGGRVAYSEAAWADAQKAPAVAASAKGSMPVVRAEPRPAPVAAAAPAADKPAVKEGSQAPTVADSGVDWMWPTSGKVVAPFSDSGNKGLDIAGKLGDPVHAAAGGKVVYAGSGLRGYGKLVIIKHDSTFLSAYAHNQNLLVKEGQTVSRGQKIAELGNSDADKPMLHFEIRKQGKPVDPARFLPAR